MECCEHSMVSIPAQTRSQVEAGQAEVIRDLRLGLEEASSPISWRCCGARPVTRTSWITSEASGTAQEPDGGAHQAEGGQQSHPGHQVRPFPLHQGRLRGTRLTLRKIKLAVEGPWHLELIIYLSELPGR